MVLFLKLLGSAWCPKWSSATTNDYVSDGVGSKKQMLLDLHVLIHVLSTLEMTFAQVVKESVTKSYSSFQSYSHLYHHTIPSNIDTSAI